MEHLIPIPWCFEAKKCTQEQWEVIRGYRAYCSGNSDRGCELHIYIATNDYVGINSEGLLHYSKHAEKFGPNTKVYKPQELVDIIQGKKVEEKKETKLTPANLVHGKVYYVIEEDGYEYLAMFGSLGLFVRLIQKSISTVFSWSSGLKQTYQEATPEQVKHFEACVKAGKYVEPVEVDVMLGYVECIHVNNASLHPKYKNCTLNTGKIYKVIEKSRPEAGFISDCYVMETGEVGYIDAFKPSTKEAYEQQKGSLAKPKEEYIKGKWYKTKRGSYVKFRSIECGIFFASEDILCDILKLSNGGAYGSATDTSNFTPLTDLSEIQKYLPDGHPDKIESNMKEAWCVQVTKENIDTIKEWFNDDNKIYSIGAHYGIKNSVKCAQRTSFGKVLTTEEFLQKIGKTPQKQPHIALKTSDDLQQEYKLGDWVQVIDGGYGAHGANGFVGMITTKEEALKVHYNGEHKYVEAPLYVISGNKSWGLCDGYKVVKIGVVNTNIGSDLLQPTPHSGGVITTSNKSTQHTKTTLGTIPLFGTTGLSESQKDLLSLDNKIKPIKELSVNLKPKSKTIKF